MAQAQRARAGAVSDLRNIVDRLDMLMGSQSSSSAPVPADDEQTEVAIALSDVRDRTTTLEGEVEQLRTLVDHLMTIATWQAKVTAALVGDEGADQPVDAHEVHDRYGDDREDHAPERSTEQHDDAEHRGQEDARVRPDDPRIVGRGPTTRRRTISLDEDIDDILGSQLDPSMVRGQPPPPDFGI